MSDALLVGKEIVVPFSGGEVHFDRCPWDEANVRIVVKVWRPYDATVTAVVSADSLQDAVDHLHLKETP